jgi:transcriptional regulator with XRE-family HTH domain
MLIKTFNIVRLLASSAMLVKFINMELITNTQCRAARGMLNWSTRDLASASHVGATTIARFERGKPANPSTLTLLRQAFEAAGVQFTESGGVEPPKEKRALVRKESARQI